MSWRDRSGTKCAIYKNTQLSQITIPEKIIQYHHVKPWCVKAKKMTINAGEIARFLYNCTVFLCTIVQYFTLCTVHFVHRVLEQCLGKLSEIHAGRYTNNERVNYTDVN